MASESSRIADCHTIYFSDLTSYEYAVEEGDAPALNIGWLARGHNYPKGTPPAGFPDRLRRLCSRPVKQMRGFEVCPFCPQLNSFLKGGDWSEHDRAQYQTCFADGRFSSAEIRVSGHDGRTYAAPVMILHYVESHQYLPPSEFINAVMDSGLSNGGTVV